MLRSRVDELGVAEPTIQKAGKDRIIVELPGADPAQQQRAKDVIERAAFLKFQIVRRMADLQSALPRIDRAAAVLSIDNGPDAAAEGRRRASALELFSPPGDPAAIGGPESPHVQQLQVASSDPAAGEPHSGSGTRPEAPRTFSDRLLPSGAGAEGIFLVAEEDAVLIERYLEAAEVQQALPRGVELRWGVPERSPAGGYRALYVLDARELITGEHLVDARALRDPQLGQPSVTFEFSRAGGRIFEQGTRQNVGNSMAVVLDERVMSAPIIREAIRTSGRIELSGSSLAEARDLALVLRVSSRRVSAGAGAKGASPEQPASSTATANSQRTRTLRVVQVADWLADPLNVVPVWTMSSDFCARTRESFNYSPRGRLEFKGKGHLEVFLLEGRRNPGMNERSDDPCMQPSLILRESHCPPRS